MCFVVSKQISHSDEYKHYLASETAECFATQLDPHTMPTLQSRHTHQTSHNVVYVTTVASHIM